MSKKIAPLARVAAGSMIFDSWDIAVSVVTHMVNQGITDFYLVDHRSSGEPRDRLLRQIPAEAKIRWVRKNSPKHSQASTMTALAHLARQDGFDAFVPFDADEFFSSPSQLLIDEVREWLANTDTRALSCVMENFYQSSEVRDFTPAELSHVHYLAQRGEKPLEHLVNRSTDYPRYSFSSQPKKVIIRLVPGTAGDFDWLRRGNHRLLNMMTGEYYPETISTSVSVLHLPCRSLGSLAVRRAMSFRFQHDVGTSLDTGDAEFDVVDSLREYEWNLASVPSRTTEARITVNGVNAVRDERLSSLAPAILRGIRPTDSLPAECIDETQRIADIALDLAEPFVNAITPSQRDAGPTAEMRIVRNLEKKLLKLHKELNRKRPRFARFLHDRFTRR